MWSNASPTQRLQLVFGLLLFGLLIMMTLKLQWSDLPPKNDQAYNILLGAVLTQFANIMAFIFPSNVESMQKNQTIATQAQALQASTAPTTTTTTTTETVPGTLEETPGV